MRISSSHNCRSTLFKRRKKDVFKGILIKCIYLSVTYLIKR